MPEPPFPPAKTPPEPPPPPPLLAGASFARSVVYPKHPAPAEASAVGAEPPEPALYAPAPPPPA